MKKALKSYHTIMEEIGKVSLRLSELLYCELGVLMEIFKIGVKMQVFIQEKIMNTKKL